MIKNRDRIFSFVFSTAVFCCFCQNIIIASDEKIIISDDFERDYNDADESGDNYGCLGTTKEGYSWRRRDINKNGPDLHGPGILEYKKNNKGMIWKNPSRTSDIVFLSAPESKVKDFKLEFDYWRKGVLTQTGGVINFRMPRAGEALSDGGKNAGYGLLSHPVGKQSMKVKLFSDYGFSKDSAEICWDGSEVRITLIAQGNHFKVYVGKTLALDVIDGTDNPARDKSGFFTLQFNKWRPDEHGLDNWTVFTLGNFGCLTASKKESWLVTTEGMRGDAKDPMNLSLTEKRGANNRVYLARIKWNRPNNEYNV